ncbi:MAG: hypothetical protein N2486_08410 [Caloramator sp.]|nr:hypothetical protein [Caloramator sp.]
MFILGIILIFLGSVIMSRKSFILKYEFFNFIFLLMTLLTALSLDKMGFKMSFIIVTFVFGLFLHFDYGDKPIVKGKYIVFNLPTNDILNILSKILKEQKINHNIHENSIIIEEEKNKWTIKVKPQLFVLASLYLTDLYNTHLYKILIRQNVFLIGFNFNNM